MVSRPQEWKWSSYRATGLSKSAAALLFTDWILSQFGRARTEAQTGYREFAPVCLVQHRQAGRDWGSIGMDAVGGRDNSWDGGRCGKVQESVAGQEDLEDIQVKQRQLGRPTLSELLDKDAAEDRERQDELTYRACVTYEYRLKEVASHLACLCGHADSGCTTRP